MAQLCTFMQLIAADVQLQFPSGEGVPECDPQPCDKTVVSLSPQSSTKASLHCGLSFRPLFLGLSVPPHPTPPCTRPTSLKQLIQATRQATLQQHLCAHVITLEGLPLHMSS